MITNFTMITINDARIYVRVRIEDNYYVTVHGVDKNTFNKLRRIGIKYIKTNGIEIISVGNTKFFS